MVYALRQLREYDIGMRITYLLPTVLYSQDNATINSIYSNKLIYILWRCGRERLDFVCAHLYSHYGRNIEIIRYYTGDFRNNVLFRTYYNIKRNYNLFILL